MLSARSPVVLIPGFTGSRLKTRLGDTSQYPLWLNPAAMQIDADISQLNQPYKPSSWWIEQMSLENDGVTPKRSPNDNGPFPGLEAISILDHASGQRDSTRYFWNLIKALQQIGYSDQSLVAAPYDWRCPPSGLQARFQYFSRLKNTIESLVERAPFSVPATIIAHSLGNRIHQYFLQFILDTEGKAWIERYIHRYIAISALWLGVPKSIREALTGADGLGLVPIMDLKSVYQSYGALPWMLPVTPQQYHLLNTTHFAYLGSDNKALEIEEALFQGAASTLRFTHQYFVNDSFYTKNELGDLAIQPPPIAHLNVMHASGQDTEIGAYYRQNEGGLEIDVSARCDDKQFIVKDGIRYETKQTTHQSIDGTLDAGDSFLPYGSLRYFTIWQQQNPTASITGQAFPGRTHYNILQDGKFIQTVLDLVQQIPH